MTRILLTGFDPFDGESVNPSREVVERLDRAAPPRVRLDTLVLPVDRERAHALILRRMEVRHIDAVVMLGEAGGRAHITPERIAINVDDYRIPDNAGHQPRGEPVLAGGPAGYFSTLPVTRMVDALREGGIPAQVSNSAGTFLCNHVFYQVMHHLERSAGAAWAGFVHLPYLHEQVGADKGSVPSMSADTLTRSVRILIETVRDARESATR